MKLQGNTVEEKLVSAERALQHMQLRARKTVVFGTQPIPISGYAESSADIIRFIFPAPGSVSGFVAFVEEVTAVDGNGKSAKGAITATLYKKGKAISQDFEVVKGSNGLDLAVDVATGDRIVIRSAGVSGMWLGFLYFISTESAKRDEILLSSLVEEA